MSWKRKSGVAGVALCLCFLLSGCGGPALKFNNEIANANKKLGDVALEFGAAVGEVLHGQQASLAKVKAAQAKWVKTMGEVQAEMKS